MAELDRSGGIEYWGEPGLIAPWLLRLRWLTVVGQTVALAALLLFAPELAAATTLAPVVTLTAASNLFLRLVFRSPRRNSDRLVAGVLLFDVLVLTGALMASGGPENPFAILYIVYIAIALAIGKSAWSWSIVAAVVAAYAAQFLWHVQTHVWHRSIETPFSDNPIELHLLGMWAATGIAAIVITYFVREILRSAALHRASLRVADRRLERMQHLASLTTLAAGAAHELSSPLATVAVLARELERDAEASDVASVREDAGVIRDEVDRCREILDRMSTEVSRHFQHSNASGSLEAFEELLGGELGEAARRISWSGESRSLVGTNLHQLSQLILPLIRNALDASSREQDVEVRLLKTGTALRVEIEDRGHGMSSDTLERAVEPFFTTKPPGAGMGLGLHLVRIVSEAMGGSLTLRSEDGQGTRATLTLPRPGRGEGQGDA